MSLTLLQRVRQKNIIDPDKLLLKQYKLSPGEKLEMILRSLVLSQVAVLIGSALYYLFWETHYTVTHGQPDGSTGSFINISLKDTWDRLPVHIDNLLHRGLFYQLGTVDSSATWDTARHDVRHVMIGFLTVLLIGSVTVGLKNYKRATWSHVAWSVPTAFFAAIGTAAALITLFAYHPVASWFSHTGTNPDLPYAGQFIGSGALQLTLIGVLAGIVAKLFLNRDFATLQLMSIERNIDQGDSVTGIRKFIYPAAYRNRFDMIKDKVDNRGYKCKAGSKWIGITLVLATPVIALLIATGIYINYFGPAVGAH